MAKDYYKILEVGRNADEKEIKASFRRLARKYHPDLNPGDKQAEARFKELNEAHEVIGDPEKRKLYDSYGSNWEAAAQGGGNYQDMGVDFGDVFSHIFQGFGTTVNQPQGKRQVQPRDVEKTVEVSLQEIDEGTKRTLTYQVQDACKSCDGTGQVRVREAQMSCRSAEELGNSAASFGFNSVCDQCEGTGKTRTEKCPTCGGSATIATTKKVEVKIPAGVPDGKKLRVPGRGGLGSNGRAGDLYVVIKEVAAPGFTRKGEDLETEVPISFARAALGGEITVPTLRGSVAMKIPELTQNGQVFRLSGQGITALKGGRGNLLVRVKITMPKSLSPEQKKLIESLAKLEEVKK